MVVADGAEYDRIRRGSDTNGGSIETITLNRVRWPEGQMGEQVWLGGTKGDWDCQNVDGCRYDMNDGKMNSSETSGMRCDLRCRWARGARRRRRSSSCML